MMLSGPRKETLPALFVMQTSPKKSVLSPSKPGELESVRETACARKRAHMTLSRIGTVPARHHCAHETVAFPWVRSVSKLLADV